MAEIVHCKRHLSQGNNKNRKKRKHDWTVLSCTCYSYLFPTQSWILKSCTNTLGCLSCIVLSFPFFVSIFDCVHSVCRVLAHTGFSELAYCFACQRGLCRVSQDLCFVGVFFVIDYMCLNIEWSKINATCQRETGSDKRGLDPEKQTSFGCWYNQNVTKNFHVVTQYSHGHWTELLYYTAYDFLMR